MSISNVPIAGINGRNNYLDILEMAWLDHLKPRDPNAPTIISLFAGAGGSSLGYSMAGFRELLAVEWDKNAVETFKMNFPDIPVYFGDICNLSVNECLQITKLKSRELDILDGSPPCQGFSTAGKRIMDDSRNQLFREYIRLLRGLMPKVFIMENVSGMVKGKMKLIFTEIMRELKASGYKVSARLMNMMYFNVPQSRERIIFIGVREDLGIKPSYPKVAGRPILVKEAFYKLPDFNKEELYWKGKKGLEIIRNMRPGEDGSISSERISGNGNKWFNLRRISYDLPGQTITKASGGSSLIHPIEDRILGLPEYKRLSSFPDSFQFIGNKYNFKARIGNSVPPLFMQAIALHIKSEILQYRADLTGREPKLVETYGVESEPA